LLASEAAAALSSVGAQVAAAGSEAAAPLNAFSTSLSTAVLARLPPLPAPVSEACSAALALVLGSSSPDATAATSALVSSPAADPAAAAAAAAAAAPAADMDALPQPLTMAEALREITATAAAEDHTLQVPAHTDDLYQLLPTPVFMPQSTRRPHETPMTRWPLVRPYCHITDACSALLTLHVRVKCFPLCAAARPGDNRAGLPCYEPHCLRLARHSQGALPG